MAGWRPHWTPNPGGRQGLGAGAVQRLWEILRAQFLEAEPTAASGWASLGEWERTIQSLLHAGAKKRYFKRPDASAAAEAREPS